MLNFYIIVMQRFWEVDFSRGLALLLMVIFNYSVTLSFFGLLRIDSWAFSWLFPRMIGAAFLFIAGISLWISWSRRPSSRRIILRGLRIFCYGLLVTAATWLFYPSYAVMFGILHLIGISIILSVPFLRAKRFLAPAIAVLLAGAYLQSLSFGFPWLLWLGFQPAAFMTFDYFPLLPWFGFFLLGIHIGSRFYGKERNFRIKEMSCSGAVMPFAFLGRHSLIIYILHQPLLVALLYAAGYML